MPPVIPAGNHAGSPPGSGFAPTGTFSRRRGQPRSGRVVPSAVAAGGTGQTAPAERAVALVHARAPRTGSPAACGSLAASRAAVSAADRCRSAAPRLVRSCSVVRAPRIVEVTAGPVGDPGQRDLGHRDAAGLGDLLHRVDDRPGPLGAAPVPGLHAAVRVVAEPGAAARPLVAACTCPDSQPPPSGLHGSSPSPASSAAGTISHSISRTSRLYCGCRVTGAASSQRRARCTALVSCQPVKFDSP